MIRRQCAMLCLSVLSIIVLSVNVYFIYMIIEEKSSNTVTPKINLVSKSSDEVSTTAKKKLHENTRRRNKKSGNIQRNATLNAIKEIGNRISNLSKNYLHISPQYKYILNDLLGDLKQSSEMSTSLWETARKWVGKREILPESAPLLGSVLKTLCSSKIIKAENAQRGTQLKLLLTLEGNQHAVFKPQWYPRTELIKGPVYAGKDRHNAEVAAFHLAILLGIRRSPLSVGRKVNLHHEVMPIADMNLLETFFQEGNNTCFYGVCYYCSPKDPVCARKDIMEGALILWLPETYKLKKFRHPWQRTYKTDVPARWEVDEHYCSKVQLSHLYNPSMNPRMLDLVDTAIFDFLIDNGDRHHYEVFENFSDSIVLLLDNGKSFGNPHRDHLDILAPLYQCCIIRKEIWNRLQILAGGALSKSLEALLKHSHIAPVLIDLHLKALDRRLLTIFATVENCIQHFGASKVIFNGDS